MAITLTRTPVRVDGDRLDAAIGAFVQARTGGPWPASPAKPRCCTPADDKTVRGARNADGRRLHLLGVHQVDPGVMLAQREMRHKPTAFRRRWKARQRRVSSSAE